MKGWRKLDGPVGATLDVGFRKCAGPSTAARFAWTLSWLWIVWVCSPANGQTHASAPLTGDAFWRQLASPASATWSGIPLREALSSLSQQWQIAFFLDRRVDPDQKIEFSSENQTLEELLEQLAVKLDLSVSVVDCVIYIGPPGVASKVATLAEVHYDAAQRNRQAALTKRRELQWPWLAEPRTILADVIATTGYKCTNLTDVPHDLWAANQMPALPITHLLTLLLAGFDLTFQCDVSSGSLRLVPMPEEVVLVREYSVAGNLLQKKAAIQQQLGDVAMEWSGNRLRVRGSADAHYKIRRILQGPIQPTVRAAPSQVRYTLRTANRFEPLARALAARLQLTIEIDPRVAEIRNRLVTIDVRNATREQLLDALVDSVGWQYELSGNHLRLFPRTDR